MMEDVDDGCFAGLKLDDHEAVACVSPTPALLSI